MLYAYTTSGEKVQAEPGAMATCPECAQPVIAKCGEIKIWHWAHVASSTCDAWGEPESAWHLEWKSRWPASQVEVVIERNGKRHRADIRSGGGVVIELQHSSISPEEIREREQFYQGMIWMFDVSEAHEADRLLFRKKAGYWTFRWKQPRKHIALCGAPVILDVGYTTQLFRLKQMHLEAPCGGWGQFIWLKDFLARYGGGGPS